MDNVKYRLLEFENDGILKCIAVYTFFLVSALFLAYENFLIYHTIAELGSVIIAFLIGTIALSTYKVNEDSSIIFLGIAYGFIGCFDLMHMFTYKGMGVFSDSTGNIPTQLWIAARYMESLSFLISFLVWNKKINIKKIFFSYLSISGLLLVSIFYLNIFPDCYIDGYGLTLFKKISEYIISSILLIGIVYFIKQKDRNLNKVDRFLILSLITAIISEMFFIHYINVYGLSNIFGHIFKLISFYFLYIALVKFSLQKPHSDLAKMNNILNKKNRKLEKSIHKLRLEYEKREKLEDEYFKKTEILTGIIESSADGILVVGNDKNIIHINNQFIRMMNIPYKMISDKNYKQLFNHVKENLQNTRNFERYMDKSWKSQGGYTYYLHFKSKKVVEMSSLPFIDKGVMTGRIINCRDITERENIEELEEKVEIRQALSEKIEEIDYMKTCFFRTISHELRTPLNIILGVIQLLPSINDEQIKDKQFVLSNEYNNIIKQNCYRLIKLADNIIDITKIDSGYANLNLKNHNIVSVIEDTTLSVVEYFKNKDISLIFNTDMEERIIACDSYKIERVILNLFSNAIKFIESKGKIEVNIRNKEETVIISVKDNGIGIPDYMTATIFDRFEQTDSSLRRKNEGSGIGLSIVKAIVEMHGGNIFLDSQVGKGSEFTIELPAYLTHTTNNNHKCPEKDIAERINIEFSDIYELNS